MQCPACGYLEMEERIYDELVCHGGESIELPHMKGQFCPKCGDAVWDDDSYDRYFKAQDALIIEGRNKANKREDLCQTNADESQAHITS